MQYISTTLGRLRLVAFLEGISYLFLLLVAMPLKYAADMPGAVKVTGLAHGVLFVLYLLMIAQAAIEYRWGWRTTALALLSSIIPFGTFWADRKLFAPQVHAVTAKK